MIASSHRRATPRLLEFAGFNLVRSSVFPVEPGGTQAVRLTYEHLLAATGDRVDYVLPRSESVEYTVPWKIAVKITSRHADRRGLFAEPPAADRSADADRGGRRACARRRDRARPVPAVVPPRACGRLGLAVRLPRPQDRRRLLPAPGGIAAPGGQGRIRRA